MRRRFDRAAPGFDAAAVLHAEVRGILLERLGLTALEPRVVLDLGAGTGHASRALRRRYRQARVIAVDASLGMLRTATRQQSWLRRFDRVCADAHRLPFADGSVDLIVSSLMLPWCDPDGVFAECRRVLAPRGLLSFSSLGPDTLRELRGAWAAVDAGVHVGRFIDMHDLGDALVRAGFAAPVLDVDTYTLTYSDMSGLMTDLAAIGAQDVSTGRLRGTSGRRTVAALRAAYEPHRRDGRLPATCEVVFGHAWAPTITRQRGSGDAAVSLEEITRLLPSRSGGNPVSPVRLSTGADRLPLELLPPRKE
jgi:malonyl-CoA O-methyltransferase